MKYKNRNTELPVKFLPEEKEWLVPAHGEIKIKFKNEKKGKITFTALLCSLRLHIKEANYGEFPKPQYVTELEAEQEASFTIVDNPKQKISDEDYSLFLHKGRQGRYDDYKFEEGKIVFTAGTFVETNTFVALDQRTFGKEVKNKDGKLMTSYVEAGWYVKIVIPDVCYEVNETWPTVEKMVKLKEETPSYREMKAKHEAVDKSEEKMELYRGRKRLMTEDKNSWYGRVMNYVPDEAQQVQTQLPEKPTKKGCCSIS